MNAKQLRKRDVCLIKVLISSVVSVMHQQHQFLQFCMSLSKGQTLRII